jgi:hypothetical protein
MAAHLLHPLVLAGITWDPFIRGALIVVVAVVVLPGSVYFVLSTDVGGRVGLLLAAAGLSGMLSILAILWLVLASTAAIGRANSWQAKQVITGDFASQATVKGVQDFPADDVHSIAGPTPALRSRHWFWPFQGCPGTGWTMVNPAKIADPESATDTVLAPGSAQTGPVPPQLKSPFSLNTEYVYIGAWTKGAEANCLFGINRHKIYTPFRAPHYVVVAVQPAVPVPANQVPPPKPTPDTSKPITWVVLERNLGSVRQPQFAVMVSTGIIFLLICNALHRRDKEIWARRAEEREAAAGGPPTPSGDEADEPVGASR